MHECQLLHSNHYQLSVLIAQDIPIQKPNISESESNFQTKKPLDCIYLQSDSHKTTLFITVTVRGRASLSLHCCREQLHGE